MLTGLIQTNTSSPLESSRSRSQAGQPRQTTPDEIAAEAFQGPSHSRLVYNEDLGRVFVEIVNRDSGEVVYRFPPEQLVRHIDRIIKENEAPRGNGTLGLILDQVA